MWTPILISIIIFIIFANINLMNTSVILPKPIECEFYNKSVCPDGIGSCKEKTTVCEIVDIDKPSHCFVLWSINNATGLIEITMKGCFTYNSACNQTECVDNSFEPRNNLNFCCCKGNMCNTEHKWVPTTTQASEIDKPQPEQSKENIIAIYVAIFVIIILGVIFIFLFMYRKNKRNMFDEIPTIEPEVTNSSSCLDLQKVQLIDIKARGRFGVVWCAQMKLNEVAVKIFPMQDRESFQTEHEIFKLPRMKHLNILEFIGAEKYINKQEFWLITAYHNRGSLCDYLKAHTVTWPDLCKIAESMSRGLMHLHEEIPASKSEGIKPAIAHRDFKSKNVLLKQDLTACIADFGLALVFQPGKACGETHGQVGTRRYMAPEVLEGAINFTRDAFLRIDVYACGLVLWELVSRCTAHGGTVGEYMLPFEAELGVHPTLEEMQENVVMKKLRPRIEEIWRTHSGISAVCDTMEECWDHDAEARLSSSCVMERISQHTKYPTAQLLIETNTDTNSPLLKDTTDNSM